MFWCSKITARLRASIVRFLGIANAGQLIGSGQVALDDAGLTINAGNDTLNQVTWMDGVDLAGAIMAYDEPLVGGHVLELISDNVVLNASDGITLDGPLFLDPNQKFATNGTGATEYLRVNVGGTNYRIAIRQE